MNMDVKFFAESLLKTMTRKNSQDSEILRLLIDTHVPRATDQPSQELSRDPCYMLHSKLK
jgi:hypothetical protein